MHLAGNATVQEFDPYNQQQAGTVTGPVTGSQFQYVNAHHLGEKVDLADGRSFRYAIVNSSTNTVAGTLNLPPAEKANHYEINPTSAVSNFTTVNTLAVTLGATAATAGEYAEGQLVFSSGTNQGITYGISYNPAITLSTSGTITLYDFLQAAVLTTDTVDLVHNQWINIVQSAAAAASQTTRPAGVGLIAATSQYGTWVCTKGIAPCLADGTVAVGTEVVASTGTAGAVTGRSTTWSTAVAQIKIGYAGLQSAIATNSKPIFLQID